jgi:hypothetical protein
MYLWVVEGIIGMWHALSPSLAMGSLFVGYHFMTRALSLGSTVILTLLFLQAVKLTTWVFIKLIVYAGVHCLQTSRFIWYVVGIRPCAVDTSTVHILVSIDTSRCDGISTNLLFVQIQEIMHLSLLSIYFIMFNCRSGYCIVSRYA